MTSCPEARKVSPLPYRVVPRYATLSPPARKVGEYFLIEDGDLITADKAGNVVSRCVPTANGRFFIENGKLVIRDKKGNVLSWRSAAGEDVCS